MKLKMVAAVAALVSLQGCAVQKTLTPIGGSRADGVVRLAYTYGMFETPKVDGAAATLVARQRCGAWGYSDAQSFGGQSTSCLNQTYQGCNQWQVTVEYQCTGQPEATAPKAEPAKYENHPGG